MTPSQQFHEWPWQQVVHLASKGELDRTDLAIIDALADNNVNNQIQVAHRLHIDKSNVSRRIRRIATRLAPFLSP